MPPGSETTAGAADRCPRRARADRVNASSLQQLLRTLAEQSGLLPLAGQARVCAVQKVRRIAFGLVPLLCGTRGNDLLERRTVRQQRRQTIADRGEHGDILLQRRVVGDGAVTG